MDTTGGTFKIGAGLLALLAFIAMGWGLCPSGTPADEGLQLPPAVHELTVANSKDRLLAYFSLEHGFTTQVVEAVRTGVPVRFTYQVELRQDRFLWDKKLAVVRLSRVITYDSLKNEFRIVQEGPAPKTTTVRSLEEAEAMACQVNDLPLVPLSGLKSGRTYRLRVRGGAEKVASSLPFQGLLEIFAPWGFTTGWHEISFRY